MNKAAPSPSENFNQELLKELRRTNRKLEHFTSFGHSFIRGLLTGFGGLLGATLIVSLGIWFLSTLEVVPIIGNFATEILEFITTSSTEFNPYQSAPSPQQ